MGTKSMRWADGFIAVDWGTTNRRAYLIDGSGRRTDEFDDHKGILSVPQGGFPEAIAEIRQRLGDKPLLLAGMIGSNRGRIRTPYGPCPAGPDPVVRGFVQPGHPDAIIPGGSFLCRGRSLLIGDARAHHVRARACHSSAAAVPT